jgi:hypothetical protein
MIRWRSTAIGASVVATLIGGMFLIEGTPFRPRNANACGECWDSYDQCYSDCTNSPRSRGTCGVVAQPQQPECWSCYYHHEACR